MIKQLKDIISVESIINVDEDNLFYNLPTIYEEREGMNSILKTLLTNSVSIDAISTDYFLNRLEKILSPLYIRLREYYSSDPQHRVNDRLLDIIDTRFYQKWNRIADALFSDYNPIENYRMEESEEGGRTLKSGSKLESLGSSEEHEVNKYSGFDSTEFKNTTGTDKNGTSSTTTEGSKLDNETEEDNNRELTRKGNIGVTTSQQMIESELELRKHELLTIIYNDMDSILFLDYYI